MARKKRRKRFKCKWYSPTSAPNCPGVGVGMCLKWSLVRNDCVIQDVEGDFDIE